MRLLVTGLPRSGTSWFARAIAAHPEVQYAHEPDNVDLRPLAVLVSHYRDHTTFLPPGEPSRPYEILWDLAFAGGWPQGRVGRSVERFLRTKHLPQRVRESVAFAYARTVSRRSPAQPHQLVKSVRILGSMEWIEERYRPQIFVVWRHPINMLGSFLKRGWGIRGDYVLQMIRDRFEGTDVWRAPTSQPEEVMRLLCARLELQFELASRHPTWRVLRHEDVTRDPSRTFRSVLADAGIEWDDAVDRFLQASNRPGTGFYQTDRVAADEPLSWRKRLTDEQVAQALPVLQRFARLPDAVAPFDALVEEVERELARG